MDRNAQLFPASPAFAENLKTFLLIRGGIAPSSPEAVPVVARVKALTKLRLRLLVERGSDYGRDPEKGGQVNTPAEATSSVPLERRGVKVSAALKQTPRQTRSGWLAANRNNSRSQDVSRTQLRGSPVLTDTRDAVESRDWSYWVSHRAARLQRLASLFTGGSFSQPLSLLIQNAPVTVTNWLALKNLTFGCSADPYCQDGAEKDVERPSQGSGGPAPADVEGPAALTDSRSVFSLHSREYRLTVAEQLLLLLKCCQWLSTQLRVVRWLPGLECHHLRPDSRLRGDYPSGYGPQGKHLKGT